MSGQTHIELSDALGKIKRLQAEDAESMALIQRQAGLLTETANALRGDPPPLESWSHANVPELAREAASRIERLQELLDDIYGWTTLEAWTEKYRLEQIRGIANRRVKCD